MPDHIYLLEPTHSSKHGKFTNQFVSYANLGFSLVRAYRIFDAVPDITRPMSVVSALLVGTKISGVILFAAWGACLCIDGCFGPCALHWCSTVLGVPHPFFVQKTQI